MGDIPKSVALWLMGAAFFFGVIVGKNGFKSIDNSADKEIIELNIELTKLNIKKLKGECNGIN